VYVLAHKDEARSFVMHKSTNKRINQRTRADESHSQMLLDGTVHHRDTSFRLETTYPNDLDDRILFVRSWRSTQMISRLASSVLNNRG